METHPISPPPAYKKKKKGEDKRSARPFTSFCSQNIYIRALEEIAIWALYSVLHCPH